ncbi:MAG: hypothetical protein EOM66_07515 [Clostridia bacterium]|nr:hypothetical protein [Clostridia bacterium]
MRLFLALGLVALSVFLGYAKAYALSARTASLSAFVEETSRLLLRMDYEALPLSRLAAAMGEKKTILTGFWTAFGADLAEKGAEEAWRAALVKSPPYGLLAEDRTLLQGLGDALASPDGAGRKQASTHILRETARRRDILREEQTKKGSLYGTLGLLFGLAAAIFII